MTRIEALILLGLHEDASRSQIQEAYSRRSKKYHSKDYDDFNECTFDSDAKHSSKRHTGEKNYNRTERRDRNRLEHRDRNLDNLKKEISDYQSKDAEIINEDFNLHDNPDGSYASDNVTIGNISIGNLKKKSDKKSILFVISFAILVFSILTTMCSTFDIDYDDSYYEDTDTERRV